MAKAGAKLQNKRKRWGRHRKDGERHACGKLVQPTRETLERENKAMVIEARKRVFGLPEDAAKREEAGSALGRMFPPVKGDDGKPKFNTYYLSGKAFEQAHMDNIKARDFKRQRSASDYSGAGGHDGRDGTDPAYVEWCDRAIARYEGMRRAILTCGEPMAMSIVQAVVIEDKEMWKWIGELRCGLNAVARVDN